jgi:hypothetical protein
VTLIFVAAILTFLGLYALLGDATEGRKVHAFFNYVIVLGQVSLVGAALVFTRIGLSVRRPAPFYLPLLIGTVGALWSLSSLLVERFSFAVFLGLLLSPNLFMWGIPVLLPVEHRPSMVWTAAITSVGSILLLASLFGWIS